MTVIASGEIDLKLSPRSQAALENQLAKTSNQASKRLEKDLGAAGTAGGASAGGSFSKAFGGKLSGLKTSVGDSLKGLVSGPAIIGAATAAGTAIAAFAAKSITHFTETAQSVRSFQRVTGQTAEEASHFVAAFDDMGISAAKAEGAMFKLARTVSTNETSLTNLGIEIGRTKDGGTDLKETFLNVADAVATTEDPAKRAEIAMAAFGRTGANLLPILEKGRAGIEKLFSGSDLNFSQAQLDSAEKYRLSLDHLGDSVGKVQNRLGAALVPAAADAAEGFAVLIDKTSSAVEKNSILSDVLGGVVDRIVPGARGLVTGLGLLSDGNKDAALSADQLITASGELGISMEGLTDKTAGQVQALLEEKAALDGVYESTLAQFDVAFAYRDSLDATEDAAGRVAEKQKALNEAIRDHGASSTETAAAREELSRALLAQEEQALRSAIAAGRLAEQDAILGGASDATIPKLDAQITELKRQRDQIAGAGGNTEAVDGMITKLEAIKAEYSTSVVVKTQQATNDLLGLDRLLNNVTRPRNIPVTTTLIQNGKLAPSSGFGKILPPGVPTGHTGGLFRAATPGGEGLALLKDGETILPPGHTSNTTNNITVIDNTGDPEATASRVASRLGERSQR